MEAIDYWKFTHGLGRDIRILSWALARDKINEYHAQAMCKFPIIYGFHELFRF